MASQNDELVKCACARAFARARAASRFANGPVFFGIVPRGVEPVATPQATSPLERKHDTSRRPSLHRGGCLVTVMRRCARTFNRWSLDGAHDESRNQPMSPLPRPEHLRHRGPAREA